MAEPSILPFPRVGCASADAGFDPGAKVDAAVANTAAAQDDVFRATAYLAILLEGPVFEPKKGCRSFLVDEALPVI